jgi:ubiquinone/menaquinone biosynthesis C-methylase UbiE
MSSNDQYKSIAPYYNEIMEHVDYTKWSDYLDDIIDHYNIPYAKTLEIASGTGNFLNSWNRSFDLCVATDLSFEMLKHLDSPSRVVMDMKSNCFKPEQFDLAFSLYDSFNYLLTEQEIDQCLEGVFRCLKPGGYFLFDIITEEMCLDYFDDQIDFQQTEEGVHILRQSNYDIMNKHQINQFTYFIPGHEEWFSKTTDHHVQKIWTVAELTPICRKWGFELDSVMGDFTLDKAKKESLRYNLLLRKP